MQDIGWAEHWQCDELSGSTHQRDDNASINLARYEDAASVVGPVRAAVERRADRKPVRVGLVAVNAEGNRPPAGDNPETGACA